MTTLQQLTGRSHLSYSSLTSWLDCGERFRLERVLNAPQSDAWWFLGGDSIHKASEEADLTGITDPAKGADLFDKYWDVALSKVDQSKPIKAGGRATIANPNKEDGAWWAENGPRMVSDWISWRNDKVNEGWSFLTFTDDEGIQRNGIEVPVTYNFDDTIIKGYIDRVMVDPNGQVWVIDLKSGSRAPQSSLQLGVYALGLSQQYGIHAPIGAYYMARKGDVGNAEVLTKYTPEVVGGWFSSAKRGIEQEIFIPKVSALCGSCSVRDFCKAVGGDDTPLILAQPSLI